MQETAYQHSPKCNLAYTSFGLTEKKFLELWLDNLVPEKFRIEI